MSMGKKIPKNKFAKERWFPAEDSLFQPIQPLPDIGSKIILLQANLLINKHQTKSVGYIPDFSYGWNPHLYSNETIFAPHERTIHPDTLKTCLCSVLGIRIPGEHLKRDYNSIDVTNYRLNIGKLLAMKIEGRQFSNILELPVESFQVGYYRYQTIYTAGGEKFPIRTYATGRQERKEYQSQMMAESERNQKEANIINIRNAVACSHAKDRPDGESAAVMQVYLADGTKDTYYIAPDEKNVAKFIKLYQKNEILVCDKNLEPLFEAHGVLKDLGKNIPISIGLCVKEPSITAYSTLIQTELDKLPDDYDGGYKLILE